MYNNDCCCEESRSGRTDRSVTAVCILAGLLILTVGLIAGTLLAVLFSAALIFILPVLIGLAVVWLVLLVIAVVLRRRRACCRRPRRGDGCSICEDFRTQ